jgi:hypothetical protein
MWVMWNLVLVHLEVVLVLVQDNKAQVEARFSLFEDSANLDARSVHGLHEHVIGKEILLDVPDGTHR